MPDPVVKCPMCGDGKLVERMNKANGSKFLGCSNWPVCDHTEKIPAYFAMLKAGAQQLPGLE